MTDRKNGFTLTFTFKGVQCQVELRKLTLVFLSILEECAELLFADVDTATHTHRNGLARAGLARCRCMRLVAGRTRNHAPDGPARPRRNQEKSQELGPDLSTCTWSVDVLHGNTVYGRFANRIALPEPLAGSIRSPAATRRSAPRSQLLPPPASQAGPNPNSHLPSHGATVPRHGQARAFPWQASGPFLPSGGPAEPPRPPGDRESGYPAWLVAPAPART